MAAKLTKAQAEAFRRRWQHVSARETEELRETSLDVKWQQFNTLLRWAYAFGWTEALAADDEKVRARWMRLRKAMRGQKTKKADA